MRNDVGKRLMWSGLLAGVGALSSVVANRELVRRVQRLMAVWDGKPGCHPASTDRTIDWARHHGVPTTILWPAGARRTPIEG